MLLWYLLLPYWILQENITNVSKFKSYFWTTYDFPYNALKTNMMSSSTSRSSALDEVANNVKMTLGDCRSCRHIRLMSGYRRVTSLPLEEMFVKIEGTSDMSDDARTCLSEDDLIHSVTSPSAEKRDFRISLAFKCETIRSQTIKHDMMKFTFYSYCEDDWDTVMRTSYRFANCSDMGDLMIIVSSIKNENMMTLIGVGFIISRKCIKTSEILDGIYKYEVLILNGFGYHPLGERRFDAR